MQTNWLTRLQLIVLYFVSQAVIPIIGLILVSFILIYIINFLFKQPDRLLYLSEIYIELSVVFFLATFCFFVSCINTILNLIKFGKVDLVRGIVTKSKFVTNETKLYFYNIIGEHKKALEIAGKFTSFKKRDTTKILVIDAYLLARKYKRLQALVEEMINPVEYDILLSRKALIAMKRDKDLDTALEQALEALDINQKGVIRNSEPKLLEVKLILTEIYLAQNNPDEAFECLKPWNHDIIKYPFYSCCKYSKFLIAWYCLMYAKVLMKQKEKRDKIEFYLYRAIKSFEKSVHGKEAKKLLAKSNWS